METLRVDDAAIDLDAKESLAVMRENLAALTAGMVTIKQAVRMGEDYVAEPAAAMSRAIVTIAAAMELHASILMSVRTSASA